jgi:hypothetical protein
VAALGGHHSELELIPGVAHGSRAPRPSLRIGETGPRSASGRAAGRAITPGELIPGVAHGPGEPARIGGTELPSPEGQWPRGAGHHSGPS